MSPDFLTKTGKGVTESDFTSNMPFKHCSYLEVVTTLKQTTQFVSELLIQKYKITNKDIIFHSLVRFDYHDDDARDLR